MNTKPQSEEKTCYSTEELQFFKELILKKIDEEKRNLEMLKEAIAGNANDVNDTSHLIMTIDDGQDVLAKENNSRLAARSQRHIKDLEAALGRIENKTYGICRITGKLIPVERLKVVPHATTTIEAKMMLNEQKKNTPPTHNNY